MNEMTEYKFTKKDAGCYLEGSHGWHSQYRAIDLAVANGWELTDRDARYVDAYRDRAEELHMPADETYDERTLNAAEIDECVSEIVDDATLFLDSVTEPGLYWQWDAGELSLVSDEDG